MVALEAAGINMAWLEIKRARAPHLLVDLVVCLSRRTVGGRGVVPHRRDRRQWR